MTGFIYSRCYESEAKGGVMMKVRKKGGVKMKVRMDYVTDDTRPMWGWIN